MVALIPQPLDVRTADGHLALGGLAPEASPPGSVPEPLVRVVLDELSAILSARTAGRDHGPGEGDAHRADRPRQAPLRLRIDPVAGPAGSTDPERYTLVVTADGVTLTAPEPRGLLHASRTLAQLVEAPGEGEQAARVPCVVVHDAPRYSWRGLSVDVARHFFDLDALCRVVDVIASYKLNVLHLHLTDDQGWRVESPSRPELVELSAGSDVSGGPGGHLSLADLEALQDHAAERGVTVVPEIDVPGHTNAATHAYGELRPDGVATDTYQGIEVGFSRLTYDLPATEPFLRDVLGDLARVTDGPYVHFGGDEVLRMEADEYARFVELCERVVLESGKTPVAWQEAAKSPLRPGTLVQYWDTHPGDLTYLVDAARAGTRVIMSPANRVYLDMKYTADFPLGLEWAGHVELRDSYDWEPDDAVPGLPPSAIEGVEAAVWTETLRTPTDLFTMLLPRLSAVAEVAWSAPARKDWDDYRRRVAVQGAAWRREGLPFHPTPQVDW
ncbi:family 20 glycosylhydrolase [Cellulosimicrobium arenosum]|uniref:beta-N-acetylhexosaminidase n=1 Tax=Cellulosimicrobium arenosum TaxID=2708133 RepID=A0A927G8P0_9MICO|nr:family 20 glycosylhydrolase [Cellulosimicrobium arenosum]MBD8079003.1 family 20 glycosylhydrolase [Cellulosimicrobium arenosum]